MINVLKVEILKLENLCNAQLVINDEMRLSLIHELKMAIRWKVCGVRRKGKPFLDVI